MVRLGIAVVIDPVMTAVLRPGLRAYRRLKRGWRRLSRARQLQQWRDATTAVIASETHMSGDGAEVPDTRFALAMTAGSGGVRKSYRRDRTAFLAELNALNRLAPLGVHVPSLLSVNFDEQSLLVSEVIGNPLKSWVATRAEGVRHQSGNGSGPVRRGIVPASSGSRRPVQMLDTRLVDALAADLNRIHQAGLLVGDIDWEKIVIGEDQLPFWVDLETFEDYPELSWETFRFLADSEVEVFNQTFATSLPTYRSLFERLHKSDPDFQDWYSPVYLGAGMRTGPIWNLDVGWGRWQYLLSRSLPDPAGRRILDIGASNGDNALEMLRSGAEVVIGVEKNRQRIAQGRFLKEAYEWCDGRTYDYVCYEADMRDIPQLDIGRFDMITAFCSLYYLSEIEMAALIRELSAMTALLVVECNERRDIGRHDEDTYRRASLEFNVEMLEANGFPEIEIVGPRGYQRPLVIGQRS